jgi:hypothetical protein
MDSRQPFSQCCKPNGGQVHDGKRRNDVVDRKAPAKVLPTRLGAVCSARAINNLNGVLNYLHVGWWLRPHGFRPSVRVGSREQLFRYIAAEIARRIVLYLEFGVAKGASIRQWSALLRNPQSALHGFELPRPSPRLEP